MILMEEQSNKIQATCKRIHFPMFKHMIIEGVDLYVVNASLVTNKCKFKFGGNPNKLNLHFETKLTKCVEFTGSAYGFSFADYGLIESNTLPLDISYDLSGQIIMYSTINIIVDRQGKTKKTMTFDIQDEKGRQVEVTLWEWFAEKMTEYVKSKSREGGVIVILRFALIKYWNDCPSISNNWGFSKLIINTDIDEILAFYASLVDNPSTQLSSDINVVSSVEYSYHDDFLKNRIHKTG